MENNLFTLDQNVLLSIKGLSKTFPSRDQKVAAVSNVSLDVPQGSLFTLLGPSGCGKTTILRSIAGLEKPDCGEIIIDGRRVYSDNPRVFIPPAQRGIGMVFQSYAIWPHMNVFENAAYPLRVNPRLRLNEQEIKKKVRQVLSTVHLHELETRPATDLSGGQQQRLALARALIGEPALLLLDEPLSNLDQKLREQLRFELKRLQREVGITTIYVTHDQHEALALSDQIAIMNKGKIVQIASPDELYKRPARRFVAEFLGSPNFLTGIALETKTRGEFAPVETPVGVWIGRLGFSAQKGSRCLVVVRAEHLIPSEENEPSTENNLEGVVTDKLFLGNAYAYQVQAKDGLTWKIETRSPVFELGQPSNWYTSRKSCWILPENQSEDFCEERVQSQ